MVIREHKPVPIVPDADERGPKRGLVGEITNSGAFRGADLLNLLANIEICLIR